MKSILQLMREAPRIKAEYPPGTRILLSHMKDPYAPVPDGTKGTVKFVDDIGQIFMSWDNGRSLPLNVDEDSFRKLTEEELAQEAEEQTIEIGRDFAMIIKEIKMQPDCPLIGADGNIFNLMGIAERTLKQHGMQEQAKEMTERIQKSGSYSEALNIIGEYVNITSVDDGIKEGEEGVVMQL